MEEDEVFEIVDEQEAPKESPKDTTVEQLKELYSDQLKKVTDDNKSELATGFAQLGESIKTLATAQTPRNVEAQGDFEARIAKDLFDRPVPTMFEAIDRRVGGPIERIAMTQMKMGRRLAQVDLETDEKELFRKYADEIDGEFGRIPLAERFEDPEEGYKRAFTVVKAKHLSEIIAAERAKLQTKDALQQKESLPQKDAQKPYGMMETGRSPAPVTDKKTISLKPGQRERIQSWMRSNNVNVDDKNFRNIVEALSDSGELQYM